MYRTATTILVACLLGFCGIASARYVEGDPVGVMPVPGRPMVSVPTLPTPMLTTPRAITSMDVLRMHQLNHSYVYVNDNPLSNIDPTGEIGLAAPGAAAGTAVFPGPGTVIGGLAGLALSYLVYVCLSASDDCGKMLGDCETAIAVSKKKINCYACFQKCQGQGKWPDRIPSWNTLPGNYEESCAYW